MARAEDVGERKSRAKSWWASVGAIMGGSLMDVRSSWGRQELNPVLQSGTGQFGGKGLAIKAGIAAGTVAIQWVLLRKRPGSEKAATVVNFGMAAVLGSVAVRNLSNRPLALPPAGHSLTRPDYLTAATAQPLR